MIKHPIHNNLLQFETLASQESLFAFTTTINGGFSCDNYKSFNLGFYGGDRQENVIKNKTLLLKLIGASNLYFPYQTHQDKIAIIDDNFLSKDKVGKQELLYGFDAIITNQKRIAIGIATADCVPILIYDPENKVLAAIHAGWRGTVMRLPQKVITKMKAIYNSDPKQLLVAIGPSISQKNFEVGTEVVEAFRLANFDVDCIVSTHKETQKYHIDLWLSNSLAIQESGIPAINIEIAALCTFDRSDLFFSARRQSIHSGRMITGGILL